VAGMYQRRLRRPARGSSVIVWMMGVGARTLSRASDMSMLLPRRRRLYTPAGLSSLSWPSGKRLLISKRTVTAAIH
jgi:hypothetical protein